MEVFGVKPDMASIRGMFTPSTGTRGVSTVFPGVCTQALSSKVWRPSGDQRGSRGQLRLQRENKELYRIKSREQAHAGVQFKGRGHEVGRRRTCWGDRSFRGER